ncbi:MAG: aminotransferase [Desulfuromonadales bacterium]|nr:aminotransferase [Desulfuromonadales bacterium]
MRFPISPAVAGVQSPPITEVKGWLAGRSFPPERPLVDLCQAVPDYAPASELTRYLAEIIHDPQVARYSPDEGLPEVREAVAAWYRRRYGAGPQPSQICLTIGASQAFWLAMTVLCQAGDEVIVPLPAYFDHPMALQTLGVVPVFVPFAEGEQEGGELAPLAARISPRTRAILLVTPSNPTGAVASPARLAQLLALARRHRLALVVDETYNAFLPGPPHQLFADPQWDDHLLHLASFGKTFALTGYRAGALVASERFLHQALKVQDTMAVCQPRITQQAVRYGCERLDGWVTVNAEAMRRRHDLFRGEFLAPGNPFALAASGAFFAWVRHPWPLLTGRQAARRLADQANLICLPGEAFGPGLENYLRLAFGNVRETEIPMALERFREFAVDSTLGSVRSA